MNNFLMIYFFIALILSFIGFFRFIYFISIGYGLAIMGIGFSIIYFNYPQLFSVYGIVALVETLLLTAYGIRLATFLIVREKVKPTPKVNVKTIYKIFLWPLVSLLYVFMSLPVINRIENTKMNQDFFPQIFGVVITLLGLILESVADWQKFNFKKNNKNYCDQGLYKIVRFPNYLGEIVFWTGIFIFGIGSYTSITSLIFASCGYIAIIYIMLNSVDRLKKSQDERYDNLTDYQKYKENTPNLIPYTKLKK